MRAILSVLRRRRVSFAWILALCLVTSAGLTLLTPFFLKYVFDSCIASRDIGRFAGLIAGFIAAATLWRLLGLHLDLRTQRLKHELLRDLTVSLLGKYYRLPYRDAARRDPGYYATRIYDEALAAATGSVDLAIAVATAAVTLGVSVLILARLSLPSTLLLALCMPVLLFIAAGHGADVKRHSGAEAEEEGRLRGFITQAVRAYKSVRLFALDSPVFLGLQGRLEAYTAASFSRRRSSCRHNTAGSVAMSYAEALIITACGYRMMRGEMTFGAFMAFMSAFWTAVNALRALAQRWPELAKNEVLVGRIEGFLSAPEAVAPAAAPDACLAFEGVCFGYDGTPVLKGLDFTVAAGERVLLRGRNGSGKSTLADMLATFLPPDAGRARTPPIERVSAALTPHPFIPGSVASNLGWQALRGPERLRLLSLLGEFELEGLLDREVDSLSMGQRKKVAVLMGLMKDADLYVFDEPLANLDAESKRKVLARILARTRGKTLVAIMHGDDGLACDFDRTLVLPSA
ncbi:MAG: ABC transporter ATP-binding protein [Elusimicrobiota bacterium]